MATASRRPRSHLQGVRRARHRSRPDRRRPGPRRGQRLRRGDRRGGRRRRRARHAAVSPGLSRRSPTGATAAGRRRHADRAGLHRRALLRLGPRSTGPARCSPPATTPRATTASRCAAPAPHPIGMETGLAEIRDRVAGGETLTAERAGRDRRAGRARRLRGVPARASRRSRGRHLRVVVDAGNGMAGLTAPAVLGRSTSSVVPLYFELDGTFPNHEANPIEPANLVDLQAEVARDRSRHRPGLRRRRRPLLPGRRARRAGQPQRADRADRRPRAGQGARRDGHPQPDHLAGGPRDRRGARRTPGAHPGGPLLHQGDGWPRPTRSSAASTPGTSTSATSGAPTPGMLAALHALAALAETDRPLSEVLAPYVAPRRQRRDQLRGGRPAGGRSTARAGLGRPRRRRPWTTSTG